MRRAGLFALTVLLLAVIGSAIAVVFERQEGRLQFVELDRLQKERDEMNFEWGRLQIEQATWAENNRIEQIARSQLGMVSPSAAETVIIKR
ncbi:cell division protein FtsL [Pseudolysobacter antarcticus]|uniref:Cell division protein FtsL n=1 Tax=Pseudolysobacter antarcticus TaxID=2511995 RepID=A0A411HGH2_9GAMM|nr:cell division protein FtsL [Pseudolysobacter antarcticus]QBB69561.1 cell division protein FtsL [Pseudolysobacter antarcticus]